MSKIESELHLPRVKLSPKVHRNSAAIINIDGSITNGKHIQKSHPEVMEAARNAFKSGRTKNMKFREQQLKQILRLIEENEEEMLEAFRKDLRKPKFEAAICETEFTKNEVKHILYNFKSWCKPDRPCKRIVNFFDQLYIYKDPYGVVLVVGAWNYPVHLTLAPLAGAIAAGNCVVIKPSDVATATAEFLAKYIPRYLDNDCYPVILGGPKETSDLLNEKFDYIFFTGSPTIGKIVSQAAAKTLTPTTLELGGKSPVYIDSSADLETATKRILWGKVLNAGQTCIAPDYVLCSTQIQQKFVAIAEKVIKEWFGKDAKSSPDYCRVVNDKHFNRIVELFKANKVGLGGNHDAKELFIEPTILLDVKADDKIMQEEIFGPVLAMVTCDNVQDAINFINAREKPLVVYVFSKKSKDVDLILENTSSGNALVNDTIMHSTVNTLPFGGVGNSGKGSYHGKYTFDTFVHKKGVLKKNFFWLPEKLQAARYPPYTERNLWFTNRMMAVRNCPIKCLLTPGFLYLYAFIFGVIVTLVISAACHRI